MGPHTAAFYADTEGSRLNEAMKLPGGDPEDDVPEGPGDARRRA